MDSTLGAEGRLLAARGGTEGVVDSDSKFAV